MVDYGDGHIVLNAQQQMAFVEQMRHADLLEWKPRPTRKLRNPLLAEETTRSVLRERKKMEIERVPPEKRVLLGGSFVLKRDLCTERRTDYELRSIKQQAQMKEQEDRLKQYKAEAIMTRTNQENSARGGRPATAGSTARSTARSTTTARGKLERVQKAVNKAQEEEDGIYEDEDRTAPGFDSSRSAYRPTARAQSGPETEDKVESYFAQARASARSTTSSRRPQSAVSGRSGLSDYDYTSRDTERSNYTERSIASSRRPQSAAPARGVPNTVSKLAQVGNKTDLYKEHKSSLANIRAKEVRKLALTRPKVAAAVRAHRAEKFLDEQADARENAREQARATAARPKSAAPAPPRTVKKNVRPKSARNVLPENPAEKGIPEGGNWKSVGAFRWNDNSPSQLAAPWASHYQAIERYPEPVYSARTKKQMMLETKMKEIQDQLAAVEGELEDVRNKKKNMDSTNNKTRAANGLPPRATVKKNTKKKKSSTAPSKGSMLKGDVTMSKSARAFMDRL